MSKTAAVICCLLIMVPICAAMDYRYQFFIRKDIGNPPQDFISTITNSNKDRLLVRQPTCPDIPRAGRTDYLIVQVFKDDGPLDDGDWEVSVTLIPAHNISNKRDFTLVTSSTQSTGKAILQPFFLYFGGLSLLANARDNDVFGKIQASPGELIEANFLLKKKGEEDRSEIRYFYFCPLFTPYDLGTTPVGYGLNIPLGLSSLAYVPKQGWTATVQPLAIGWGWKAYLKPDAYLGLNLAIGYTGYATTGSENAENDTDNISNFTFASITYAAYLDISNLFFVGVGYTYNAIDKNAPGWMLLGGIGTNLSIFLKK
jgi:hypothetical protein